MPFPWSAYTAAPATPRPPAALPLVSSTRYLAPPGSGLVPHQARPHARPNKPPPTPPPPAAGPPHHHAGPQHFDKPLLEAAAALGVCKTKLKSLCRNDFGIARWPFRKGNSVRRMMGDLRANTELDPEATRDVLQHLAWVALDLGGEFAWDGGGALVRRPRPAGMRSRSKL